ncbi:MAG: hypothetical protein GF398_20880 [Chitinivibrionales bacterium]|nr:hypothetical protein [Chitinivibrionales bacterium]
MVSTPQTIISWIQKKPKSIVFTLALCMRVLYIAAFGDTYYLNVSGTMFPHYNMAANLADHGRLVTNELFIHAAEQHTYHGSPRRNIDYYKLEQRVQVPRQFNSNPHIEDTWGYAALLGLLWKVFPIKSYLFIQIFQALIDSYAAVLILQIVLWLFGGLSVALSASIAYAVFPPFAFFAILPIRDYFPAWGAIYSLYFFIRGVKSEKKLKWWLSGGAAIALSCWFRPTLILLPCAYALWIALTQPHKRIGTTAMALVATAAPVMVLFWLPFVGQFYFRYGSLDFGGRISGMTLWIGLGKHSNKYHFEANDRAAYRRALLLGYPEDAPMWTPQSQRLLRDDALRVIKADPLFYLNTVTKRYVRAFFTRPPFPLSEKFGISFEEADVKLRNFAITYPLFFAEKMVKILISILFPLVALFAFGLYRERWREILLLVGIWQYRIFLFLPFHLEDRYVMECYFPVVILAAVSLQALVQKQSGAGFRFTADYR